MLLKRFSMKTLGFYKSLIYYVELFLKKRLIATINYINKFKKYPSRNQIPVLHHIFVCVQKQP